MSHPISSQICFFVSSISAFFISILFITGIIVKSTTGKNEGITPRWFEILDVGPEIDWIQPGQWVYVEYGRWSEALTLNDDRLPEGKGDIWRIDSKGCMLVSDEKPDNQFNYNTDTAFAGPE